MPTQKPDQMAPSRQTTKKRPEPVVLVLIGAAALGLAGCSGADTAGTDAPSRDLDTYRAEAAEVLADARSPRIDSATSDTWSIVLASAKTVEEASARLNAIRTTGRLPEAYIEERGAGAVIAVGRYGPDEMERGRRDLDDIRAMLVEGGRPYAFSFLAPPATSEMHGSNPDHDLRNVKRRFGPQARYTLQIGVYAKPDRRTRPNSREIAQFRQAAEEAVRELRQQGEQAFYYHAPTMSMVTVGIFGDADHDTGNGRQKAVESVRLRQTRSRHPHNLLNGQGIRMYARTIEGEQVMQLQGSSLVEIP